MKANGKKFLYEEVYETLKGEILEGVLDYGVRLPSEREISLRFSVERTTVRKALQMLVDDALVEKQPGIGTRVVFRKMGRKKEKTQEHKKTIGVNVEIDEITYGDRLFDKITATIDDAKTKFDTDSCPSHFPML